MDVVYRPARAEDLELAVRLVQQSFNDLRVRHGLAPTVPLRPPAFQAFCLAEDPDGLWVAESDDGMVGFGFSWMQETFWYLAQLFIKPETQGRGIGQALLSRTLEQAQQNEAKNRALITLSYNSSSIGLYVQNGMYPCEPLFRVVAPASVVQRNIWATDCDVVPIGSFSEGACLGQIDEEVLGFRRDAHHGFLVGGGVVRCVRVERSGGVAGYAYISSDGHIGPLAVAPEADGEHVVAAAIHRALVERPQQVSMIIPGTADRILGMASELGFRIDEPMVLMSAHPFGKWRNYLPSNPGYM